MGKVAPALLEMEVHNGRTHDIYLTRPSPSASYVPGHIKVTLSHGAYPDSFEVELAYVQLPDGRIFFKVSTPPGAESEYEIRAIDMSKGSIWYTLYSGRLSEIPTVKLEHVN